MRLRPPPARLITAGLVMAATLGTSSCTNADDGEEVVFDRAAYCREMTASAGDIDAEAMADGNAEAYEIAGETYERLAALAPEELSYEWRVIISGMEAMIREADGEDIATDEETAEFRSAYQTVYSDYTANCLETASPEP
jgi:hypothetical protein